MSKFNFKSRIPRYDCDSDYTTNAPSYYDALARFSKSLKSLIERMNDVEEHFKELVIGWLEDGTLAGLLEQVLLDDYATEVYVQQMIDDLNIQDYAKIEWVEQVLNDYVEMVNQLIADVRGEMDNLEQDVNDIINDFRTEVNETLETKLDMLGYYENIEIKTYRDKQSNTTYHLAKIPRYDDDGNLIKIKVTDDRDTMGSLTTREFSILKQATLMMNASPNSSTSTTNGRTTIINNGDIRRYDTERNDYNYLIGIKEDNTMVSLPPRTDSQSMLRDGYVTVIPGFIPLINNGQDVTTQEMLDMVSHFTEPHPRSVIAQDCDRNTYFFVCEGRLLGEYGMYTHDIIRVLLSHGMIWAHMLDGGGSSQLVYYHHNVNRVIDDNGSTERPVRNAIYVGKDNVNKTATKILSSIGDATMKVFRITKYHEQTRYQSNNWVELEDYLINGWKNYGTSGSGKVRGWVLPNNTLYLVGTITGGEIGKPFMKLPDELRPSFDTHHLVPGDKENQIYKVIIGSDGYMQWYYWNSDGRPPGGYDPDDFYLRLDGIMLPLNPEHAGIQEGWNSEIGLTKRD